MKKDGVFLICIGSELIKGETLNTNFSCLGKLLFNLGIPILGEITVPDNLEAAKEALDFALQKSSWVITSGGLGPTFDDQTRSIISEYFNTPLEFKKNQFEIFIKNLKKKRKLSLIQTKNLKKQFYIPKSSKYLNNRLGSAPGFILSSSGSRIVSLPGVPSEFLDMLEKSVLPLYQSNSFLEKKCELTVKAIGISEVDFLNQLGELPYKNKVAYGIYPDLGHLRFVASSKLKFNPVLRKLKSKIKKKLKDYVYSYDGDETFSEILVKKCIQKQKTIALAESCTGGMVSEYITQVSGSSKCFKGGVVAYNNSVKESVLNISRTILRTKGAVSKEVASALATNVRKRFSASVGIGITGIAGPTGGSKTKPVGLVYIGVSYKEKTKVYKHLFNGDRDKVRNLASNKAMFYLWKTIETGMI